MKMTDQTFSRLKDTDRTRVCARGVKLYNERGRPELDMLKDARPNDVVDRERRLPQGST